LIKMPKRQKLLEDNPQKKKRGFLFLLIEERSKKEKLIYVGKLTNNEIETPDHVIQELNEEFGVMFDPCPYVGKGLKPNFDGLSVDWKVINYVNPPYTCVDKWILKAVEEWHRRQCVSVFLVPVRAGTKYWNDTVWKCASSVRFIRGNIAFKGYTIPMPHNLAVVVFGNRYPHASVQLKHLLSTDYGIRSSATVNMKTLRSITEYSKWEPLLDQTENGRYILNDLTATAKAWRMMCEYTESVFETTVPFLAQLVLPFYMSLVLLDSESKDTFDFGPTPDSAGRVQSLPELLRCARHRFLANPTELQNVVSKSVFCQSESPSFTSTQLEQLHGFYVAYRFCLTQHLLNVLRLPYQKQSQDRGYLFNTVH